MMINRHRLTAVAGPAVLAVALIAAGCGSSTATSTASSPAAASGSGSGYGSAATASNAAATGTVVKTTHGSRGTYLTDGSGRALYLWMADSHGRSHCTGACAQAWPPLITRGKPTAAGGVSGGKLTTVARAGGARQVVYNGHPLYRFAGDTGPGSTAGQGSDGFGARWWLVAPAGAALTAHTAAAGSSSSAGGGWG